MGVNQLIYTLQQLRDIVGISVETFRHWQRVIPAFSARKGRRARFSTGDLLAAAIIRRLTDDCGIRIGRLKAANQIVSLCNEKSWALDRKTLVVNPAAGSCQVAGDRGAGGDRFVVLCPLKPIMSELRGKLLNSETPRAQRALAFPLIEVKRKNQTWR